MSDSIWDDPRITSYVLDELSDSERSEFESEMSSQSELADAVEEARGITGRVGELFESESTPELDSARREAILDGAKMPAKSTRKTKPADAIHPAPSWGVPLSVMAMAATLLLLVGVAPWLRQKSTVTAIGPATENNGSETLLARAEPKNPSSAQVKSESLDAEMADLERSPLSKSSDLNAADVTAVQGAPVQKAAVQMNDAVDGLLLPEAPMAADAVGLDQVADTAAEMKLGENGSSDASIPTAASLGLPDIDSLADAGGVPGNPVPESFMQRMAAADDSRGMQSDGSMGRARDRVRESMGAIIAREKTSDTDIVKQIIDQESATVPMAAAAALPAVAKTAKQNPAKGDLAEADGQSTSKQTRSMKRGANPSPPSARVGAVPAESVPQTPMPAAAPTVAGKGGRKASRKSTSKSKAVSDPRQTSEPMTAEDALLFRDRPEETDFDKEADSELLKRRAVRIATSHFSDSMSNRSSIRPKVERGFDDEIRALNEKLFGGNGAARASGDHSRPIVENEFRRVSEAPVSMFSVDVETASYAKVRDDLMHAGKLPSPDAARIEELINYFDYGYAPPASDAEHPFATHMLVTDCPWNEDHRLVRVAVKGKTLGKTHRRPCNLVFLLDTSGSMDAPDKLSLVTEGISKLLNRLTSKDQVAIAVYADAAGLVLASTSASKKKRIRRALTELSGGGSTASGEGIELAFQVARENFVADGVNRVIVCTDGDFAMGMTNTDDLVSLIEKEAESGIFVTSLGIRIENRDVAELEQFNGPGRGGLDFVDTLAETQKNLADQTHGIPAMIAKDVQLSLEFNPSEISQYRLMGYENQGLLDDGADNIVRDAKAFAMGRSVTAIFEIVPVEEAKPEAGSLKYGKKPKATDESLSGELLTLTLRYKLPDSDESKLAEFALDNSDNDFGDADESMQFATAVAGFGMQLRSSPYAGNWELEDVLSVAEESLGEDEFQLRKEFLQMVRKAGELMKSGE